MSIKAFPRPARRHEQALQLWMIVSSFVAHKCIGRREEIGIITYGEAAVAMGYPVQAGHTLSEPLGLLAKYCLFENIPLLNVVVVNFETGQPGHDVILKTNSSLESQQEDVLKFDWFGYRPPTMRAIREAATATA